jgi:hypothetical protein
MTIATSRLVQLGALTGAVAVGLFVLLFVGGLAGGLYAAAALVFGLFAHFKLGSSGEPAPRTAEPYWNRWGRSRAQVEDLADALRHERERVAERDTYVELLRGDLEKEREAARVREGQLLRELATLEKAHVAEIESVVAAVAELEEQLAGFDSIVESLADRRADSPHGGHGFPAF